MASNVTRNHHLLTRNLKLRGNYISNDGGDEGIVIDDDGIVTVGANQLTIDRNITSTSDAAYKGLFIDVDKTGASEGINTIYGLNIDVDNTTATDGANTMYGIYCTPTLTHAEGHGVPQVFGIYSLVTGGANGLASSYGMKLEVNGSIAASDQSYGIYLDNTNGGADFTNVSSASSSDYFTINTIEDGETTLTTVENGVGSTAHLNMVADGNFTVDAEGDISLDADGDNITMKAGSAGSGLDFIQSGTGDYTIKNLTSDKDIIFNVNDDDSDTEVMRIDGSESSLLVASGKKIEFGAAEEYISGDGTDLTIASGGHVEFDGTAVGFDQKEPAWGDANTLGGGGTSTDIDFRIGNKQHLTLAGNHVDGQELQMIFPTVSGNFLLFLLQDGTGDRTVHADAWRAYSNDESTNSAVIWAGGTAPTLTTTADKADIVSIYWDADNEKAYGVISQNF